MAVAREQQIITIDGPSGVGKSTVSLLTAQATGFSLLDTGAMYRAVAFQLRESGVVADDEEKIAGILKEIKIEIFPAGDTEGYTKVIVNNREITNDIRSPEISMLASRFSALGIVRSFLTRLQRQYGERGRIVAEGRDMGSVVFPGAAWKFYLDAELEVRARRRCQQFAAKGEKVDFNEMQALISQRDQNDSNRKLAPLKKAEDAVFIDTTRLTKKEVLAKILNKVRG